MLRNLEKRIDQTVRAERQVSEQNEFEYLTSQLAKVAHKKLAGKKLLFLQEQLDKI